MSKFINETLHPKTQSLINHILLCADHKENGDDQFYNPLLVWREAQGMTDEKAANLYTRLAETFADGRFLVVTNAERLSGVSRCLWINDKAVLA